MARGRKPVRVRVRMYQVGFGDCFLISFEYDRAPKRGDPRKVRHVLIDFGSTRYATKGPNLEKIGKLIKTHCDELDVVVVTHRHKDHLGGFGITNASKIIEDLKPKLIVRSWTEDPKLAKTATRPRAKSRTLQAKLGEASSVVVEMERMMASLPSLRRRWSAQLKELKTLAFEALSNKDAVTKLEKLGKARGAKGIYVEFNDKKGRKDIESLLPGVDVQLLGPPTPEDHPNVARQRGDDEDEFWLSLGTTLGETFRAGKGAGRGGPSKSRTVKGAPGPVREVVDRMREQGLDTLLSIVRDLDDALNNTSVILLFEARGRRLLFPGDAQIENWEYALGKARISNRLKDIDLYKVGHHGSRNATPKSLFSLWEGNQRPMMALMSTKGDVHGHADADTEVPRETLVDALQGRMELHSTEDLPRGQNFLEVECDLESGEPFKVTSHD